MYMAYCLVLIYLTNGTYTVKTIELPSTAACHAAQDMIDPEPNRVLVYCSNPGYDL